MSSTELDTRELDIKKVMGEALPEVDDPELAQRAIAERILNAEDLPGLFVELKTTATKDMVGIPIEINGCRVMRSGLEGARGTYLLIEAVRLDTGEVIVLNSSALQIMSICLGAARQGVLPLQVVVAEAAAARPGRSAPLTLRPTGKTLEAIKALAFKN